MTTLELTYGKEKIGLKVEDGSLAGPLIKPKVCDALPGTPCEIIRGCFLKPKGRPKLSASVKGERVGIIVNDELRVGLQEPIISCLLAEIASGQPKEVYVFIATGSHHPELYARQITAWIKQYAEELQLNYKIFPNYCDRADDFILLGETTYHTPVLVQRNWLTCTVRVHGHEAKYHYMNGYSCMDKHIVPGIALPAFCGQPGKLEIGETQPF